MAMPIFESQRLIVRELYGIECSDLIDYDRFSIPWEGSFDLVICNHMLTHVVRPGRFFDQVRERLLAGGHLYLYNEFDEEVVFSAGKPVLSELNALHLQAFDAASLARVLNVNGFDVVFIKKHRGTLLCLAKLAGRRDATPLHADERSRRLLAYAHSRARSILRAPEPVRSRFAHIWNDTVQFAVASGIARFDGKGALRLSKD